ncbi:hypothetical protein IJT10_08205 [bacterium]|nr:hypothetical protein [bacterium]
MSAAKTRPREPKYGGFSQELCGGCHCTHTGDIGLLKFISEGAIAADVRRIEAVTGHFALELIKDERCSLEKACEFLHTSKNDLPQHLDSLLENQKKLERELDKLKEAIAASKAANISDSVQTIAGIPYLLYKLDSVTLDELRKMADQLKQKFQDIAILAGPNQDKVVLLVLVTLDYVKAGFQAGKLVKELGGGDGDRYDMALAGAKDLARLDEVLAQVPEIIKEQN